MLKQVIFPHKNIISSEQFHLLISTISPALNTDSKLPQLTGFWCLEGTYQSVSQLNESVCSSNGMGP